MSNPDHVVNPAGAAEDVVVNPAGAAEDVADVANPAADVADNPAADKPAAVIVFNQNLSVSREVCTKIPYRVKHEAIGETGHGTMGLDVTTPISATYPPKKKRRKTLEDPASIVVKNYLPCLFLDEVTNTYVCKDFDKTLVEYLNEKMSAGSKMLHTFHLPTTSNDESVYNETHIKHVDNAILELLRAAVDFVFDMHRQNLSGYFDMRNVVLRNDLFMFTNIKFHKLTDGDVTEDETKQSLLRRETDWGCVGTLATAVLAKFDIVEIPNGEKEEEIPKVLKDFITKCKVRIPKIDEEKYFRTHLALMTSSEKICYMQNLMNRLPSLPKDDLDVFNAILGSMDSNVGWTSRFKDDKETKIYGAMTDCYHNVGDEEDDDEEKVKKKKEVKPYYDEDRLGEFNARDVNKSLLRFVRNCSTHMLKHIRRLMHKRDVKNDDREIPLQSLDLFISHMFEKQLLEIHRLLFQKKILFYFVSD